MTEQEWLEGADPRPMVAFLLPDRLSARKARLFACACCRRLWHLLEEDFGQAAIAIGERMADGLVSDEELNRWKAKPRLCFGPNNDLAFFEAEGVAHQVSYRAFAPFDVESACATLAIANARDGAGFTLGGGDWPAADPDIGELKHQSDLLREIIGNPFRPGALDPRWLTSAVIDLARTIYEGYPRQAGGYVGQGILADALMDAGCDDEQILAHCRSEGPHVRGCWVVDPILGKV